MALSFAEAFHKVEAHRELPCALLVTDPAVWGLERGMRQVVVFDWRRVDRALLPRFLEHAFAGLAGNPLLIEKAQGGMAWKSGEVVPFAILGRDLHDSGVTFEAVHESRFEGVLLFDLLHGPRLQCPVLLWDGRRLGKVAADASLLGIRQGVRATGSGKVAVMAARTFARVTVVETRYWVVSVTGRRIQLQRGVLKPTGARDWSTHETKEGEFDSAAEALLQAQRLMEKYLADGYAERESLGE
ncbi:MAG: hypothetical protein ACYC8T_39500 [Myxococcaceae bacterium]